MKTKLVLIPFLFFCCLFAACGDNPDAELYPEGPETNIENESGDASGENGGTSNGDGSTSDGGTSDNNQNNGSMTTNRIKLIVGSTTLTATLADNSSARALLALLADGDRTINMTDYGNMEKVGPLGTSLPRNDERITTTAGDLILYQGNSFVIYYAPNTWTFTRLGKIDNINQRELIEILGSGNVTVRLAAE